MAGQIADHDRICAVAGAGDIRTDQANCGDARPDSGPARRPGACACGRSRASRRGDCRRKTLIAWRGRGGSWMSALLIANIAPIMFAASVVVLLLGYLVAFSLGAVVLIYVLA